MRLASWAGTLPVPSGDGAGDPWPVVPWQRRLFAALERRDVEVIAASCARGNGKTAVASLIARAYLPGGPLHRPGRSVLVVSASHPQARLVIGDMESWREEGWRVANSHQVARIRAGGAEVRAVAANPRTLHGARPDLILADELAQWMQPDRMYAALRTSLGKRPGARLLAIGTRPVSGSGHVFDGLLEGGADVALQYAARPDDPPFQRRTWRRANPSLDVLPSLERTIRREAREARRDPAALARFRALRLNLGVADTAADVLVSAETWAGIEGRADVAGPVIWGVDLGTTAAMSAVASYWPSSGRLDVLAAFPAVPGLRARGLRDGVGGLYADMSRRGELMRTEGHAVDVAALLREAQARFGRPVAMASDRWREGELRDALAAAGVPAAALALRGQGYRDGGEDVRLFRRAVAERRVAPVASLLLRAAMAEARTVTDPAGNAKLAKAAQGGRRSRARDDAAAAAVLAVAEGVRRGSAPARRAPRWAVAGR